MDLTKKVFNQAEQDINQAAQHIREAAEAALNSMMTGVKMDDVNLLLSMALNQNNGSTLMKRRASAIESNLVKAASDMKITKKASKQ